MEKNLRNIIDDENPSKRRPMRGGGERRGGHGDDRRGGGVRNRYQGGYNNLHENFGPPIQHAGNYEQPRQGRDGRRFYPRRGNDDFGLQGGERERRNPGGAYNNHQ